MFSHSKKGSKTFALDTQPISSLCYGQTIKVTIDKIYVELK